MRRPRTNAREAALAGLLTAGAMAGGALVFSQAAREAERSHPPLGRVVEVDGVRLHVHEAGRGPTLVVLHGNGAMVQDILISPAYAALVRRFRVILIDRPGFGHSLRPRGRRFGPTAQAQLFCRLFRQLGLRRPIVLGHSWGCLPAISLGLDHPGEVGALVLASGYFYPEARSDIPLFSVPAIPGFGDAVGHTMAPVASRLMWPRLVRRIFAPNEEPEAFRQGFPKALALRPSQLRAAAADTAAMLPAARRLAPRYPRLTVPLVIVTGDADQVVDPTKHALRLHRDVPASRLRSIPGVGHMVHHSAPEAVVSAVEEAARMGGLL